MSRSLAVALAALTFVIAGCSSDGSSSSPPAAGPSLVHTAFRCPDPQVPPASDGGSDSLPGGARAAMLCVHDNHDGWSPPHDRLTTDLDGLVRIVNAQQVHQPKADEGCGGVGAPAWSLVLRYHDGTRTISGDNGGCWDLLVGDTRRVGSARVFHAYLEALLQQRQHETAPDVPLLSPPCPRHAVPVATQLQDLLADASETRTTVACVLTSRDSRTVVLSREMRVALHHDLATAASRPTNVSPRRGCRSLVPGAEILLRGTGSWGDRSMVRVDCDVYRLLPPASSRYEFVRLLPSTERMLRQALNG